MAPPEGKQKPSTTPDKPSEKEEPSPTIRMEKPLIEQMKIGFNLTEPEAMAYTSLLVMGQLTLGDISIYSGVPLEKIETVLDSLMKKQLVKVMPGIVNRFRAFMPYLELGEVIRKFHEESATLRKDLSTIQAKASKEISSRLQKIAERVSKEIQSREDEQSTALEEVRTSTMTLLDGTVQTLQKALTTLTEARTSEISSNITTFQQTLQESTDEGIIELRDAVAQTRDKAAQTIAAHQTTSEQLIKKASSRILQQLENLGTKLKTTIQKSTAAIQLTAEEELNNTTAAIINGIEQTRQRIEKGSAIITKKSKAFSMRHRRLIDDGHKSQTQMVTTSVQAIQQQLLDAGHQEIQILGQFNTQIDKTIHKELQGLTQEAKQSTTEIHSTIEQGTQSTGQMGDDLAQKLQQSLEESIQGFNQLQREITEILSQWIAEPFTNTQAIQLKGELSSVTRSVTRQHEKLLRSIKDTMGIEIKDAHLTQLAETLKTLESISQEFASQRSTTKDEVDAMLEKLDEEFAAHIGNVRETANVLIRELQSGIKQLEARGIELGQASQTLLNTQAATIFNVLKKAEDQLRNFSKEQLEHTQQIVQKLGVKCTRKVSESRRAFKRQMKEFEGTVIKQIDDYLATLQQELDTIRTSTTTIVNNIGITAETLNRNLTKQIVSSVADFHTLIEQQQTTLDKQTSTIYQTMLKRIKKLQTDLIEVTTQDTQATQQVLEEFLTQTGAALETVVHQLENESRTKEEEQKAALTNAIEEYTATLAEAMTASQTAINTSLEKVSDIVMKTFTGFRDSVAQISIVTAQELDQESSELKILLDSELAQTLDNFTQALEQTQTTLTQVTQDASQHVSKLLLTSQHAATTELQGQVESITSALGDFNITAENTLRTQTQQTHEKISNTLNKRLKVLKAGTKATMKDIKDTLKAAETEVIDPLNRAGNKIEPLLKAIQTKGVDTHKLLIQLGETIQQLQPSEAERTWRLVTRERIQSYLRDMLRRARTTITLVYPSFDEVPIDLLHTAGTELRIHLVTTVDREKRSDVVQRLIAQGNIRIWHNPKMEFYAGARDGEEVLIAPIQDDPKEFVAIVSDQESYVTLFKTLGPRWIASSKEIRRKRS